jgi:predicted methyltransferase
MPHRYTAENQMEACAMKPLLAAVFALLLAACHGGDTKTVESGSEQRKPIERVVGKLLKGDWRSPENVARDKYRHPAQTLAFFGIQPTMTVIEIWPSTGWYSQILAPYLRDQGHYIGAVKDPAKASDDKARAADAKQNQALRDMFASNPKIYGPATLVEFDAAAPDLGPPGSADAVVTFRNVHNWVMAGNQAQMFEAFFEVLKPGGVLGVVDHRAAEGVPLDQVKNSGYLPEQYVISLALRAGFLLDARSDINANPNDPKNYPLGVWALPPTLSEGDKDREKYLAIGESDRMTLRFVKPRE